MWNHLRHKRWKPVSLFFFLRTEDDVDTDDLADPAMASSSSSINVFEPKTVSLSVTTVWRSLEKHGYFYQAVAEIGTLVDTSYETGQILDREMGLHSFLPMLRKDPVSRR